MIKKIIDYFKIGSFNDYWKPYGGFLSIKESVYSKWALLITLLVIIFGNTDKWYEKTLNILPDLLGFSIGTFAILLALGDTFFWKCLIKESEENISEYSVINSTFVHFIFIQILAVIYALFCEFLTINNLIMNLIGIFLLVYAILLALAATFAILKVSKWYEDFLFYQKGKNNDK